MDQTSPPLRSFPSDPPTLSSSIEKAMVLAGLPSFCSGFESDPLSRFPFKEALEQTGRRFFGLGLSYFSLPFFGFGFSHFSPDPPTISSIEKAMVRPGVPFYDSDFESDPPPTKSAFEKAMEQTGLPFFGSGFGYFEPYPPPLSPAIERAMERTCLPFFGSSFRLFAPDMPSKSSSIESVTEPMTPFFSRSFAAHIPSESSIVMLPPQNSIPTLPRLREICDEDYCEQIPRDVIGASITFRNACEYGFLIKERAELALKFYNDGQGKNFKLHRVCKANKVANVFYGLTFEAKEGENEDCLVFRGVVHLLGGDHAVYREIKDDEIKRRPADDDYVSSESHHHRRKT